MDWIKVTPDTMPPDMEPVEAIIHYPDGFEIHVYNATYNHELCRWVMKNPNGNGEYIESPDGRYIDRWMPYPGIEED